jgi:hypothetical protein
VGLATSTAQTAGQTLDFGGHLLEFGFGVSQHLFQGFDLHVLLVLFGFGVSQYLFQGFDLHVLLVLHSSKTCRSAMV